MVRIVFLIFTMLGEAATTRIAKNKDVQGLKENTIAAKRFVGRDAGHKRAPNTHKTVEGEEAVPINKEEIDKEIDAMIAV